MKVWIVDPICFVSNKLTAQSVNARSVMKYQLVLNSQRIAQVSITLRNYSHSNIWILDLLFVIFKGSPALYYICAFTTRFNIFVNPMVYTKINN